MRCLAAGASSFIKQAIYVKRPKRNGQKNADCNVVLYDCVTIVDWYSSNRRFCSQMGFSCRRLVTGIWWSNLVTWVQLRFVISALLTAGYLPPIVRDAFFPGKDFDYETLEKKAAQCIYDSSINFVVHWSCRSWHFPNGLQQVIHGMQVQLRNCHPF